MGKTFTQVDSTEKRLINNMKKCGLTWQKIQEITGRSSKTLQTVFQGGSAGGSKGVIVKGTKAKSTSNKTKTLLSVLEDPKLPPSSPLSIADLKALIRALHKLQKAAGGRKEVTIAMVKKQAKLTVLDRACLEAFHANDIWFNKLKERPILKESDVEMRFAWGKGHEKRTEQEWVNKPHAIIDNKNYKLFTRERGRDHAARRGVRGAYQLRGAAPKPWLVKPKADLTFPAKGVQVTAAVIRGKIRMWEYVEGKAWNSEAAAAMYRGPLVKAMAKAYPEHAAKRKAKWVVLEDNDPAGYKSGLAKKAKAEVGIKTDDLPFRSPDLNVLDYSLWHTINIEMRKQEAKFRKNYKEPAEDFKDRLRRTALGLPAAKVKRAVKDMKRRVAAVVAAEGGLFET